MKLLIKIFLPLAAVAFCIAMLASPEATYSAAQTGLDTWWNIVFPSLLPFFIVAELFMGLGIVHLTSVLLEPIMRPLFRLPGSAAFVVALGFSSGFPMGAVLSADLRKKNLITRNEGERLLAFTNNSSPLFIFVALAVGLFHRPEAGWVLAIAHYGSNLLIGVLLGIFCPGSSTGTPHPMAKGSLLGNSIRAMLEAQKKDGRPLGRLLGDAVLKSIHSMAVIGGFIVFFAVLIRLLNDFGITNIIDLILSLILMPIGFSDTLYPAFSTGLFEMTLGSRMASASNASFSHQMIAASMILGWGGLSIHAQVAGMVAATDLRIQLFILARLMQSCLSGLLVFLLLRTQVVSVLNPISNAHSLAAWDFGLGLFLLGTLPFLILAVGVAACFLCKKTVWLLIRTRR